MSRRLITRPSHATVTLRPTPSASDCPESEQPVEPALRAGRAAELDVGQRCLEPCRHRTGLAIADDKTMPAAFHMADRCHDRRGAAGTRLAQGAESAACRERVCP